MLNLPLMAQLEDITCGAVCFASMLTFFRGSSPDEGELARELKIDKIGYADPREVMELARAYHFKSFLLEGATKHDLLEAYAEGKVIFVTWWDEDAGHYSLIESIDENQVILMDPWLARKGIFHHLKTTDFLSYWALRGSKMITVSE